jgi:hypothetical protein
VQQEEPTTSTKIKELLVDQAPVEVVVEEIHMVKETEELPPLKLKELPQHLEYAFLDDRAKMPVIISSALDSSQKSRLLVVLKKHKHEIAWRISDIKGINPSYCTHKILMEEKYKPVVQHQGHLNPNM